MKMLEPCSTCGGTGEIDERLGGIATSGVVPCPDCHPTKAASDAQKLWDQAKRVEAQADKLKAEAEKLYAASYAAGFKDGDIGVDSLMTP